MKATSVVFDTDAGTDDLIALAFLPSRRDAARQPLARMVVQILELMGALLDADETFAWDPLAAVSLVDPAVLSTRRRRVEIRLSAPEEGRSVAVPGDGGNVDVAFAADERRFRDVFVHSLAGRPDPV